MLRTIHSAEAVCDSGGDNGEGWRHADEGKWLDTQFWPSPAAGLEEAKTTRENTVRSISPDTVRTTERRLASHALTAKGA